MADIGNQNGVDLSHAKVTKGLGVAELQTQRIDESVRARIGSCGRRTQNLRRRRMRDKTVPRRIAIKVLHVA